MSPAAIAPGTAMITALSTISMTATEMKSAAKAMASAGRKPMPLCSRGIMVRPNPLMKASVDSQRNGLPHAETQPGADDHAADFADGTAAETMQRGLEGHMAQRHPLVFGLRRGGHVVMVHMIGEMVHDDLLLVRVKWRGATYEQRSRASHDGKVKRFL